MSTIASLLTAVLGVGVFLSAASAAYAWYALRIRVYEFLRSERPEVWTTLNPDEDVAYDRLAGRALVSPNRQLREFVRSGYLQNPDAEISTRCAHANRAAKRTAIAFLGLIGAALALFLGIAMGL